MTERWRRTIDQALLVYQISGRKQHVFKSHNEWVSEDTIKEVRWH